MTDNVFGDVEVWAIPLNTALLIILALVNTYIARKQREEKRDLIDLKRSIGVGRRWTDSEDDEEKHLKDTGERRRLWDRKGGS